MKFLGPKIREARKKRGWSGERLCYEIAKLGRGPISRQSLSHYETKKYKPDAEVLALIAEALDFPIGYFFVNKS